MNPTFYLNATNQKRPWTPTCGAADPLTPGSESTLRRVLACRILELDVADWLGDALGRLALPDPVVAALNSNIADETRHDKVLNMAAAAYGWDPSPDDAQARALRDEWVNHPDHPITKAAVLESSVFFVLLPLLRRFGGMTLRVIARDISGDETSHAAIHRQLSKDLGYAYSPSLDRLRRRTIEWVVDELDIPDHDQGSRDIWLRSSDSLLERGVAPDLKNTRRSTMPAFFEISNDRLPRYA